jgi:ABC-type multidrug transport system ATPase subunit
VSTQILVTHHVELVLSGAHYVLFMRDGRIATQGTTAELRAAGVLDEITHAEAAEVVAQDALHGSEGELAAYADIAEADAKDAVEVVERKPLRKLVEEEKREQGGIRWDIYRTYLRAS